MNVNIGGDRLGSGAKMNVSLHNYNRSTHNLSKRFQSSIAPGVLYPAYVNIGLNGDKFDIDIKEITRTLPTRGPLFSTYKMQIDAFVAPIRLYHGVLHNNPINIGMNMKDVILPSYKLAGIFRKNNKYLIHPSSIWSYLGMRGFGTFNYIPNENEGIYRKVNNAVPFLVYYDIFKNYYANKQEDNFQFISYNVENIKPKIEDVYIYFNYGANDYEVLTAGNHWVIDEQKEVKAGEAIFIQTDDINTIIDENDKIKFKIYDTQNRDVTSNFKVVSFNIQQRWEGDEEKKVYAQRTSRFKIRLQNNGDTLTLKAWNDGPQGWVNQSIAKETSLYLEKAKLENIDKMREMLLNIKLGETFEIGERAANKDLMPYYLFSSNYDTTVLEKPLQGLCVKTYQSDLFNNWIKTETIDGSNGISEITKVDTTDGLKLDALNLAQKVYNMLNRIAVSGGTYEDWQEAVYSYQTIRKAETPIYVGGYSSEVYFDEVVATSGNNDTPNGSQVLGELGGRGRQYDEKGGRIKFDIDEPSIIMIMVSYTPRISYSQGNKFYLTEISSIDDLHKPALDGIGYQDLLVEQMAWNGSKIDANGDVVEKLSAGKTVAWINYMTDVDECYGDFAYDDGLAFMTLNRNYDVSFNADGTPKAPQDITTYIDPRKFNYAFTYDEIDAQNFWTEIYFKIESRRLMSAKQIPNL